MMTSSVALLVAVCAFFKVKASSFDDSIKTLSFLLNNQESSSTVDAFVCWDHGKSSHRNISFKIVRKLFFSDRRIQLLKSLNDRHVMIAIANDKFSSYNTAGQHNNFMVIDFACDNVEQLFDQVSWNEIYLTISNSIFLFPAKTKGILFTENYFDWLDDGR